MSTQHFNKYTKYYEVAITAFNVCRGVHELLQSLAKAPNHIVKTVAYLSVNEVF